MQSNGGLAIYLFNPRKASSHFLFQLTMPLSLKALKNGLHLSIDQDMNRERATIILASFYTSLVVVGDLRLARLTLIPLRFTMKPRNLSDSTPNPHLVGLSFIQYCRSTSKHFLKLATCLLAVSFLTSMSSTYTYMVFPISSTNILLTRHW